MTIDPGIKLLIVDDLPENLLALEASIRDDGYSIHQASSGEEALALLLEHEFALADMPDLAPRIRSVVTFDGKPFGFVGGAGQRTRIRPGSLRKQLRGELPPDDDGGKVMISWPRYVPRSGVRITGLNCFRSSAV